MQRGNWKFASSQFENGSRRLAGRLIFWARSSVVERSVHIGKVTGPIPVEPTKKVAIRKAPIIGAFLICV